MLNFKIVRDPQGNITHIETPITGKHLLQAAKLNKGNAFTEEERRTFRLLGKLPNAVETLEEQALRFYHQYREQATPLQKNLFLNQLHDHNETLFFKLIGDHLEEMLPIIYTPIVGDAVQKFSLNMQSPRGLFLSYPDKDHMAEMIDNRLNTEVDLVVVTDGERVLGIGDQGVGGMNISIAKLMVYTLCAGVNPHRVLPIQLDVGTNNPELLHDPMYVGWRHERITGKDYDDFIGLFVSTLRQKLPTVYLHWEDFGRDNARKNLERYRNEMTTFNDDMQGTGAIALSCVLSGVQAAGQKLTEQNIVFFGAGTAGVGIADQICAALVRHGLTLEAARQRIFLIDRFGLILDDMSPLPFQQPYAKSRSLIKDWKVADAKNISLQDVANHLPINVLIGCSALGGAFTQSIIEAIAKKVETPIILPLSNPTSKSEAHPEDVLKWTQGKAIVATGSPFDPVTINGKSLRISQSNNSFIFPGLGLGVIAVKARRVTDDMIWTACATLTAHSPAKQDKSAPILPEMSAVRTISREIAKAVATQAIAEGVADPVDDIDTAINRVLWEAKYYPYQLKES